jgi:hypothetical protein
MPRKHSSEQAKQSALESEYTPLYAVAGLTDALADALKEALAEAQEKASKRIGELSSKRPVLEKQAKESADELRTFVITLPEQFKHLPETTKARIAELQKQANELIAHATSTYSEYAGLGKEAVDEAVGSARRLSSRTEKQTDETGAEMAETVSPPSTAEAFETPDSDVVDADFAETVTPPSTADAFGTPETDADVAETVTEPSTAEAFETSEPTIGETPPRKAAASADN